MAVLMQSVMFAVRSKPFAMQRITVAQKGNWCCSMQTFEAFCGHASHYHELG